MAIKIRGIDHIVLRVRDVDAALHFYCEVLGCHEERRVESFGLIQLRAGNQLIDLLDIDKPLGQAGGGAAGKTERNVDHFAVRLEHFNEAEIRAHLERHGIKPGQVGTRYGADGDGPSMYIRDPDGNTVELKG